MTEQAIVIDFLGTIVDPLRLKVYPETEQALKKLKENFDVFVSSVSGVAFIEEHLKKQKLDKIVFLIYGREDGDKHDHLEKVLRFGDYEKVLYIASIPEDFEIEDEKVVKIAVNACTPEAFSKDVIVFKEPLSVKIVEQII